MEQHPIPRQITTFEFKLIGFLTLKQFIYIAIFGASGVVVYFIFPIPLLNVLIGVLVAAAGLAFAFLPVNDRPLDVWIRNLYKRLTSPTQYVYHKHNPPVYFLRNLYFLTDPHRVMSHIESQEKLTQYLAKTSPKTPNSKIQNINNLLHSSNVVVPKKQTPASDSTLAQSKIPASIPDQADTSQAPIIKAKTPFFSGVIKNHKLIPIPGILIYVKDDKGATLRLLKTNPHGVFATFNPLPPSDYSFEIKDPKNTYFFDTIKVKVENINTKPLEFYSKELL